MPGEFHTVMALPCRREEQCNPRVPIFSSRKHQYNGFPLGDEDNDNARRLKRTVLGISKWKDPPTRSRQSNRPSGTPAPTLEPTPVPIEDTDRPTQTPTEPPTAEPTTPPTAAPTQPPSASPTAAPTRTPTVAPTLPPTNQPTRQPSSRPTRRPTANPSAGPTTDPTPSPTSSQTPTPSTTPSAADGEGSISVANPRPRTEDPCSDETLRGGFSRWFLMKTIRHRACGDGN